MALKRKIKDINTVDEKYRDLYTQKKEGEDWVLTEIEDHDAPDKLRSKNTENGALRLENNKFKGQLSAFEGVDVEAAANALQELAAANAELEVLRAGSGKDSKAIEAAVNAKLTAATSPLQTKLAKLQKEHDTLLTENTSLKTAQTTRTIEDSVVSAFTALKVDPKVYAGEADDPADGQLWARQRFHLVDGKVVDKVTGLPPKELLEQMRDDGKRPHWFGETSGTGSGALGSDNRPASNPWMQRPHWNPDKQSEIQMKDPAKAELLAKQAGCPDVDAPFHPKDGGPREVSQY